MHTTLKNVELLKHFKISKTAPTCFGLWGNRNKLKHVGAVLLILKCFNNSMSFNVVCISWILKCWMLLMHGVTMMYTHSLVIFLKYSGNMCSQILCETWHKIPQRLNKFNSYWRRWRETSVKIKVTVLESEDRN